MDNIKREEGIISDNLSELKQMKVWVCWNFIEKDGRKTKKPLAASGKATGTNNLNLLQVVST